MPPFQIQTQAVSGLGSSLYWYQVQAHIRPNITPYAMTIFSTKADFTGLSNTARI